MPKVGQSFWRFSFLDNNFYGNIYRAQSMNYFSIFSNSKLNRQTFFHIFSLSKKIILMQVILFRKIEKIFLENMSKYEKTKVSQK